jgi:hypothetical protein
MARPAMTTRQLLIYFKQIIHFIMDTCGNELDAVFFRSSHSNGTRLRALAIHHSMPSLNFMPVWRNETAYVITQAVLRQKGRMTKAAMRAHADGTLELPWSSMNMKGIPSWRPSSSLGPTFTLQHEVHNNIHNNLESSIVCDPSFAHVFACPKCFCTRSVVGCSLLVRSGWGHILCKACRITSRSMTWQCICRVPWHTCAVHASTIRGEEVDLPPAI